MAGNRPLSLTKVTTPTLHPPLKGTISRLDVQKGLQSEFKEHGQWTKKCTELFSANLVEMYCFDRISHCTGRAYGNVFYRVLINPIMALCYHPSCLSKGSKPVRLKNMSDIGRYVQHLRDHSNDEIGVAMIKRFSALLDNIFITDEELDNLSRSPFQINPNINMNLYPVSRSFLEKYGIYRGFKEVYICHWKDKLISSGIIKHNSLTFQEDEALVFMVLRYPDPVDDWSLWGTLALYCMKLLTSISSTALNLYRGITRNRLTQRRAADVIEYVSEINHASPSVSNTQKKLPPLNFENEVWHQSEMLFHLTFKEELQSSVVMTFSESKVLRIPITLGIDDQENNQGTFIQNGKLYGLRTVMTIDDLKRVGLENLADHIASGNPFVVSVREYRITDMDGDMNTNVYTSFEAGTMEHETCKLQLMKVVEYARTCKFCLKKGLKCYYENIDKQCANCEIEGCVCVSFVVFHALWDMGSFHKKTALITETINCNSPLSDLLSPKMFTIGFGGLHLAKAITNAMRNHILTHEGMNYGMNVFRAVKKQCADLDWVKQAVYVAKDRQSDLLSYLTSCPLVSAALKKLGLYCVQRIPEPVLTYTANAKTQKEIVYPVSVGTNRNGDIFVLDSGSACIHVIDRSVVSKVFLIGSYNSPSTSSYSKSNEIIYAPKAKFSNKLIDMVLSISDDIFILDEDRQEIVVGREIISAKSVSKVQIHVMSYEAVSLSHSGDYLMVLTKNVGVSKISFIDPLFPSARNYRLAIDYKTMFSVSLPILLKQVFAMKKQVIGVVDEDSNIHSVHLVGKKLKETRPLGVTSTNKPCVNKNYQIHVQERDEIHTYDMDLGQKDVLITNTKKVIPAMNLKTINCWGQVLYAVKKKGFLIHTLEEIGPLDFGVKLCQAISSFYEAICYSRPGFGHGPVVAWVTLRDAVIKATPLTKLLKSMQEALSSTYEGRESFLGEFGIPWSSTIQCVLDTVESWEALVRRLEEIDPALPDKIYSHAVTNESVVEHAFGYAMTQGQGHLQDKKEYTESKRHHTVDFQIRMTDTPFCQYTKVKLRDKGYQSLVDTGKVKLSAKQIMEIFKISSDPNENDQDEENHSEEDKALLQKAYLLTKSVPRQSNRCKWRESSGYQPNLLRETVNNLGQLICNDMVFSRDLGGNLVYLVIKKSVKLNGKIKFVKVRSVKETKDTSVLISNLVLNGGRIATVPSALFEISDGEVLFNEEISDAIEDLNCIESPLHNEEEWATLMDGPSSAAADVDMEVSPICEEELVDMSPSVELRADMPSSSGIGRKRFNSSSECEISGVKKKKTRQIIEEESSEEDEDSNLLREVVPMDGRYYVVALSCKRKVEHYIGLTDFSLNQADQYWMQFLRKTNEQSKFQFKVNDSGLVSIDEIIKELDNPLDNLTSSSRSGKVTFNMEQLSEFEATLQ